MIHNKKDIIDLKVFYQFEVEGNTNHYYLETDKIKRNPELICIEGMNTNNYHDGRYSFSYTHMSLQTIGTCNAESVRLYASKENHLSYYAHLKDNKSPLINIQFDSNWEFLIRRELSPYSTALPYIKQLMHFYEKNR